MEKYISIINSPAATDFVISGNTVSVTGLKPFSKNDILSLKAKKYLWGTPMKYATDRLTLSAGDTIRFSITQNVNNILETYYFSYVFDSYANLITAISNWSTASAVNVTVVGTGTTDITITATADTTNVSFEIGGSITTAAGLNSGVTFTYTATLSLSSVATATPTNIGDTISFSKTAHGLKNGQVVTISGFTQCAAGYNGGIYRVSWSSANAFTLSSMNGTTCVASNTTAGASGVVTVLASEEFGTYTQVNAEALANGSTQTATSTTSSYSCLEIQATYSNTAMGNLVQPQLFTANVWYVDAASSGVAAQSAGTIAFEAAFQTVIS